MAPNRVNNSYFFIMSNCTNPLYRKKMGCFYLFDVTVTQCILVTYVAFLFRKTDLQLLINDLKSLMDNEDSPQEPSNLKLQPTNVPDDISRTSPRYDYALSRW